MSIHQRTSNQTITHPTFAAAFNADLTQETWLVTCPHDDDGNIGAGLTLATAIAEGVDMHVGIVTNGRQGYCSAEQKENIIAIRHAETIAAYAVFGIPEASIHFLDYDDGTLYQRIGVRAAAPGDPSVHGKTGMEASLTELLRRLAPKRVLTPASSDLHPDHQAVFKDLLISTFHAGGDIWPELGAPVAMPEIYEFPIYVELDALPDYMIETDDDTLQRKLDSIACFASQKQITVLVDKIRAAGAVEFLRNIQVRFYDPAVYRKMFQ